MNLSPMTVEDYRLTNAEFRIAQLAQRQGKTMREISDMLGVPFQSVEQSLYWDLVSK